MLSNLHFIPLFLYTNEKTQIFRFQFQVCCETLTYFLFFAKFLLERQPHRKNWFENKKQTIEPSAKNA